MPSKYTVSTNYADRKYTQVKSAKEMLKFPHEISDKCSFDPHEALLAQLIRSLHSYVEATRTSLYVHYT